jgi:hypothetical protein
MAALLPSPSFSFFYSGRNKKKKATAAKGWQMFWIFMTLE